MLTALFGRCGGDGAMLVGKPKKELPPIAVKFRKLLQDRGWTPTRLHEEAVEKFGEDAAVAHSFRRLIGPDAPESETSKARIQAESILIEQPVAAEPTLAIEQMAEGFPAATAIAPLIGHLPAARDATEEQIVAESRKLMNSRHASLHALLTLMLSSK